MQQNIQKTEEDMVRKKCQGDEKQKQQQQYQQEQEQDQEQEILLIKKEKIQNELLEEEEEQQIQIQKEDQQFIKIEYFRNRKGNPNIEPIEKETDYVRKMAVLVSGLPSKFDLRLKEQNCRIKWDKVYKTFDPDVIVIREINGDLEIDIAPNAWRVTTQLQISSDYLTHQQAESGDFFKLIGRQMHALSIKFKELGEVDPWNQIKTIVNEKQILCSQIFLLNLYKPDIDTSKRDRSFDSQNSTEQKIIEQHKQDIRGEINKQNQELEQRMKQDMDNLREENGHLKNQLKLQESKFDYAVAQVSYTQFKFIDLSNKQIKMNFQRQINEMRELIIKPPQQLKKQQPKTIKNNNKWKEQQALQESRLFEQLGNSKLAEMGNINNDLDNSTEYQDDFLVQDNNQHKQYLDSAYNNTSTGSTQASNGRNNNIVDVNQQQQNSTSKKKQRSQSSSSTGINKPPFRL